jgi:hypothetical protein
VFEAATDPAWNSGQQGWDHNPGAELCDGATCGATGSAFNSNGIQMAGCADNTQNGACTSTGYITNPGAHPSCGVLTSGQGLIGDVSGDVVSSCTGSNFLKMLSGNVLLYHGATAVWSANTTVPTITAVMQGDGNFVISRGFPGDSAVDTVWATNTFGNPGSYMAVQSDGNLVVYTSNGIPIWDYNNPAQSTSCGRLNANQGLSQGASLSSCDRRFKLTMQLDGNLVLSWGTIALWSSNTSGWGNLVMCVMQGDGNFVVYNRANSPATPLWASNTFNNAGNYLVVQNDGNMVVYDASAIQLWASNTGGH